MVFHPLLFCFKWNKKASAFQTFLRSYLLPALGTTGRSLSKKLPVPACKKMPAALSFIQTNCRFIQSSHTSTAPVLIDLRLHFLTILATNMYAKPKLITLLFYVISLLSCKKDPAPAKEVNLADVRLQDFSLIETAYTNIDISHPVVVNGEEKEMGEIEVTIPKGNTQLRLTPKASNFTEKEFSVSPQLGIQQNFSNTIIYTITSAINPAKTVHYIVKIKEEADTPVDAAITGFRFLRSKNPGLPADVQSVRIIHPEASLGKIFVWVPPGTNFASLTPSIAYNGTGLFYSQDGNESPANMTMPYPAAGRSIDFAYPKQFYVVVKSGTQVKAYEVIVDVNAPVKMAQAAATTVDVKKGTIHTVQATTLINEGNHPISIIGVDHNNHLPAGTTAVRGMVAVPSFGLLPGASTDVKAVISAQTYPAGTYEVTASFKPRLYGHPEADDLLEPSSLRIKSTVVD